MRHLKEMLNLTVKQTSTEEGKRTLVNSQHEEWQVPEDEVAVIALQMDGVEVGRV